jgi:hypothetical protein
MSGLLINWQTGPSIRPVCVTHTPDHAELSGRFPWATEVKVQGGAHGFLYLDLALCRFSHGSLVDCVRGWSNAYTPRTPLS